MAARASAPVVGAQGSPYLEPDHWQFSFGWRHQYSDKHFIGSDHQQARDSLHSQVKNDINLFDFGFTYGWSADTTISVSIPYLIAERSSRSTIPNSTETYRNNVSARGIGDVSVVARKWLLDVETHTDENIALGLGVKLPTGQDNAQDTFVVTSGSPPALTNQSRTVDQSIQPGDGGWGYVLDGQAFTRLGNFTPYFSGSYLFNPRGTNGVTTWRFPSTTNKAARYEKVMSVADQYLARLGTMIAIPDMDGLAFGIGGRIEGVPVRDIIGSDRGFRRPGFAISAEPQLVYAHEKDVYSLSVPYALYRNRQRSVADQKAGTHGDAAFADYMILFSWSRRF